MAAPTIQIKRGLLANLPGLKVGEPGFTTDKYDLYVGLDGTTNNNKFFGSHRYWNKETNTVASSVRLVEGTNNGSNFIALKSPDSLGADTTYTFPATPTNGYVLQTDGSGVLSWVSANTSTGITIFDETTQVGLANSISSIYIKGEGITATAAGTAATITVSAASATVAGVSSYNSSDFYFTNTYNVGVTTATTSTKGIASFSSTNFTVSAGAVSIANNAVGLGTQTYGQYAKTVVGGDGLTATAANADDGTDYTVNVNTGAGITITSDAVALKNAGSLTNTYLTKWNSGAGQLENATISDDGTTVNIASNLYVSGNISLGGTSVIINAATLQVKDRDIVLGVTTDGSNNDVSTDLTATHGGIAIASTVGNPLINFPTEAGVNALPSTYKQFMWIKSNSTGYPGLGTDAWVSNYAISIGNTATVQNGSRLTVGAGFTVYDTYIDTQDIRSSNINNTGFVTTTNLKTTNLYDSNSTNGTSGQFLTVTGTGIGWTTISGVAGGTISTATRSTTVDTATAVSGTYYPGLFSSSTGVNGATVNVDAGISYVSNTDTLTVQNLTVPGTLTGTATTATKINTTTSTATGYIPFVANGTTTTGESLLVNTGIVYNASTTRLGIGTTSPRATLHVKNDLLVSAGVSTSYDIAIKATTSDSGTLSFEDPDSTKQYFSINKDTSSLFAINDSSFVTVLTVNSAGNLGIGTTTPTSKLHVVGNAYITGIVTATTFVGNVTGTATTATKINTTTSTASGYIPFVANSTTTTGESLLVDSGIQYDASSDTLTVSTSQHSAVKAADGTSAITITSGTGAVTLSNNLTVSGNLYVNGTTTQVNTAALTVEDRTIDLGIVDGFAPTSATTWDLGILFNYFDTSAKKSGVIWENTNSRFQFANSLTSETAGSDVNSPQIVAASFAPIEIGALWVNDTAGQSVVASYLDAASAPDGVTAGRYLQNITVDAGTF